jgi:hypothetical protein
LTPFLELLEYVLLPLCLHLLFEVCLLPKCGTPQLTLLLLLLGLLLGISEAKYVSDQVELRPVQLVDYFHDFLDCLFHDRARRGLLADDFEAHHT